MLRLAQEFAKEFANRKLADGVLDFHDLEQFALKLLWDFSANQPTAVAEIWRKKLHFVFVDEYQDINAAQDKIIAALSRDAGWGETPGEPILDGQDGSRGRSPHRANRFLVGDVKQSIYRFRLADPKIFRDYARDWHGANGQVIPLSENFRSHESLLDFVNSIFAPLMREELGGVEYNDDAKLNSANGGVRLPAARRLRTTTIPTRLAGTLAPPVMSRERNCFYASKPDAANLPKRTRIPARRNWRIWMRRKKRRGCSSCD